jgi:uncharacterized membrane protein (DUF2068 family)
MDRPIGITILAILQFISSGFLLLVGLLILLFGNQTATFLIQDPDFQELFDNLTATDLGGFLVIIGGVLTVFALISVAIGVGLWRLRTWAWWVCTALQVLGLIGNVLQLLDPEGRGAVIFAIMINGLILAYLLSRPVKNAFAIEF